MTSTAYQMQVSNALRKASFGYKNKDQQQLIRKKVFKVSNPLGEYYLPFLSNGRRFHEKTWTPNGVYQVHRRYAHGESGLRHYYEKQNVDMLKDIVEDVEKPPKQNEYEKAKTKDMTHYFKEFDSAGPNDFIVTIEYCSSCEEHSTTTQHSAEMYKSVASNYQKIIQERFPFIKVFLKPIDVVLVKEEETKLEKTENGKAPKCFCINDKFKPCRIGAFEIQFYSQRKGIQIIHSKLFSKKWPQVDKIISRILQCLPYFELQIILYDRDDYEDREKINHIPISLYLTNGSPVQGIVEDTEGRISEVMNPRKRLETMRNNIRAGKEAASNENEGNTRRAMTTTGNERRTQTKSARPRTTSGATTKIDCDINSQKGELIQKKFTNIDEEETFDDPPYEIQKQIQEEAKYRQPTSQGNAQTEATTAGNEKHHQRKATLSNADNGDENAKSEEEEEEEMCGVTTKVFFKKLKYDSYIIETGETSDFLSSINMIKFSNVDGTYRFTKHIGLMHQTKAIFQVFPYIEKEKDDGKGNKQKDFELIKSASITVLNVKTKDMFSITLTSRGLFEYKTEPGEYKLTITDKKFETVKKTVKIEKGVNKINIKLHHERQVKIFVRVSAMEINEEEKKKEEEKKEEAAGEEGEEAAGEEGEEAAGEEGVEEKKEEEKKEEEEQEDPNTYTPISNAEIEIYKSGKDILAQGITDCHGKTSFLIDTTENSLTISVKKIGYYPSQRFFSRSKNLKINNKTGNYELTINFILLKEDTFRSKENVVIIGYTNLLKKVFEFNHQIRKGDDRIKVVDNQKKNGIIMAIIDCSQKDEENEENEDDYGDVNYYDQIMRVGFKYKVEDEQSKEKLDEMNDNQKQIYYSERIEYLNKICAECVVYTPNNFFSVKAPSAIFKTFNKEEEQPQEEGEENEEGEEIQKSPSEKEVTPKQTLTNEEGQKEGEEENKDVGLYWDLGWLDFKNKMFYETSTFFKLEEIPIRENYFEEWIELLQKLLDNQIYKDLFTYFNFNFSYLNDSDRFGNNEQFINNVNKLIELNPDPNDSNYEEKVKKMNDVFSFILSIFSVEDDVSSYENLESSLVSFSILKKKITSNLKNFCTVNEA
ncbi:MAG: hypothetical protein MJ252_12015 [archaeon]|nr:hypothetical protein [archaeon]